MTSVPTISITTPELESNETELKSEPIVIESDKEPYHESDHGSDHESADQERQEIPTASLETFYEHKSILLTGATGFVGKAVLWKLLYSLSDSFDKVYILLRPTRLNQHSPERRLKDDILSNKVYNLMFFIIQLK
ncbi:hypothetical protein G6F56_006110 [Rhizopus delemar]|nr:hypothetical protein G6F56_006110 [Rhizopus delemar]